MESFCHIDISDSSVLKLPVIDNGEKLVSIRGHIDHGPPPESQKTKDYYHLVRSGILDKLKLAQSELPKGLKLRLYEGYRSPEFQETLFQQHLKKVIAHNPDLSRMEAYAIASQLVAPTKTFEGKTLLPPHSSGAAVDVDIIDHLGRVLDFGMKINDWKSVPQKKCETIAPYLSNEATSNRALLVSIMSSAGFINYSREWWHFSYGDQYWAYMTNNPQAIYGNVLGTNA